MFRDFQFSKHNHKNHQILHNPHHRSRRPLQQQHRNFHYRKGLLGFPIHLVQYNQCWKNNWHNIIKWKEKYKINMYLDRMCAGNAEVNKKVLLRERKRHTDRRVASTLFVGWGGAHHPWRGYPSSGPGRGGGIPNPWGYPRVCSHLDLAGVVPLAGVPQGTPIWTWPGVPHPWGVSLAGVPHPWGYPPVWTRLGGYPIPGGGTPI